MTADSIGFSPSSPPISSTITAENGATRKLGLIAEASANRGDRKHENDRLRGRRRVGNEHADRRGVNGAAKSPNDILDRRAK